MSGQASQDRPPVPRFRLELVIFGNTLQEVQSELGLLSSGGFIPESEDGERVRVSATSGRFTLDLTEPEPEMTPERYARELKEWALRRRAKW